MLKIKFWVSMLLLLLSVNASAQLHITVKPHTGWGEARTSNIERLCENVALHFQEQLRDAHKISGDLTIVYNPGNPKIWYRSAFGGDADDYKIGLSVTDRY